MKRILFLFLCLQMTIGSFAQSPVINTGYGTWVKMYYCDDFNDPMYEHPHIQTYLHGEYDWLFFIRFTAELGNVFELFLSLENQPGEIRCAGNATINIKNVRGQITKINVPYDRVKNNCIYLTGTDAVTFANAINGGNYKMSIKIATYLDNMNNPGTYVFSCTNETKDFFLAVNKNLGTTNLNNSVCDVEVTQNMGNFSGNYILKGKIDEKYAVTMNLRFDNGLVNGTYYYDRYKQRNKIEGSLANLGPMNLIEYDGDKAVGEYIGTFNGRIFAGDFLNYSKKNYLPFVLKVQ